VRVLLDGALLLKQDIDVSAGQDVLDLVQRADNVGLKRYELQISAKNPADDRLADDNRRSSFVRVRGPSSALVLAQDKARAEPLAEALRSAELHVTVADLFGVPQDVAELSEFDLIALVDIPAHMLTPAQLGALAVYVRHLGGGLLLMGSDQTLGPGGYGKTPIEDISPVSFDLKQDRKRASLAEVIVIDYSGSMSMEVGGKTKLELANEASVRSASLLSSADQLGVMHVDTEIRWTRALSPVDDKEAIAKTIRAVGPGGGGIYVDLGLREAYAQLRAAKTSLKHVLLFADGADAEQMDNSQTLARDALSRSITTSVVSLGQGSDVPKLEQLSRSGGGRFYLIEDARRLPAVFAQETILAARSALNEVDFVPAIRTAGGALRGVDFSSTPQLHGYVVTIPKPRAEVLLDGPERDPLLAVWSVGLGRVGAFTSDYGSRWGQHWTGWPGAAQLFAQLGRSLARDHDDRKVRLRTEASSGSLSVTADVLDERGALDSYRELAVHVAGPGDFLQTLPLEAMGPGRYGANMPLERPGAYVVSTVELTSGKLVATGGAELSASDELRPTGTHRGALERIAREGGGELRDTLAGIFSQRLGLRFAYDDVSGKLLWSSAALLLLMVTFRRLSFPEWLERALRFRSTRAAKPNKVHGAQAAVSQVLSSKRKQRQRPRPNPSSAVLSAPPFPVVKPPQSANAPKPLTTPQEPAAPAAPRTLSAAEILLARRRNRRDN
jgi:Ca-activated chloride channel family protein